MDIGLDWGLLGFVAACTLAASSGAIFQPGGWYRNLNKPSWNPPDWLFPIAWTLLYAMIAVAGWLVWRTAGFGGAGAALAVYFLQLVLNAGWSALFFGLRRPDWAFYEVIALWASILGCVVLFWPIHAGAAWLMVPYLLWVTFAAVLNAEIWRRNPIAA
jgi:tryptophan-rich sensory protein